MRSHRLIFYVLEWFELGGHSISSVPLIGLRVTLESERSELCVQTKLKRLAFGTKSLQLLQNKLKVELSLQSVFVHLKHHNN